jgi:hypothetical protein
VTVSSKVKQTLASLKGVQATLRIYSNQSQINETKTIYQDALKVTGEVILDLENRVKALEYNEPQYKGN